MHAKQRNPSRIQAQEVAQKGPECDAKVCLTRPSNPLKTLGPEPRLVCFIQRSNPIQTILPHPRQPCSGRQVNGSFCLGWLELQGPENMEWPMHAKQRNPSRIQAQEVAQKGPECNAKVCLTRPSNPLKTLGPEPRLVCFIQRSNPIQTLLPHPRQPCSGRQVNGSFCLGWLEPREHGVDDACETAKPQQDSSPRGGPKRFRMRRQGVPNPTFEPVKNTRTWASAGMLHPTFKPWQTLLPHHRQRDACETAKPQQDSSPRGGPKRSRMRRQGVPNPTFEPVKNTRTWASAGMLHPTFKPYTDTITAPSAARCMRNSETPAGFKPKRWPKKVPNATPRCA